MEVCDDASAQEVETVRTTHEGENDMPDAIPADPVVNSIVLQTGPELEENSRQGQKVRECFKNQVLRHLATLEEEVAALKKLVEGAETLESCCTNGTGAKKTGSSGLVTAQRDERVRRPTAAFGGEASCSSDPDVVELMSSDDDCAIICSQPRGVPKRRPRRRKGGNGKRCRGGPPPLPSQEVSNPARLWVEIEPMFHGYMLTWDYEPKSFPVHHYEVFFSGEHRTEGRIVDWELLEETPDEGVLINNLKPQFKYYFSVRANYKDGTEGEFSNIVKSN